MARRATLTNEALAALGAEKLAKIVLDEAGRNAPFKKLVTAALAGAKGRTRSRLSSIDAWPGWSGLAASSTGRSARPSQPTSGRRAQPLPTNSGQRIRRPRWIDWSGS
jgi:hypothetical protein